MTKQIDRYFALSDERIQRVDSEFHRFVSQGDIEDFEKPLASLTRKAFQENAALKKLWRYWYVSLPGPKPVKRLDKILGVGRGKRLLLSLSWHEKSLEVAKSRLTVLVTQMYELAVLVDLDDVEKDIDRRTDRFDDVMDTTVGNTSAGIEYLQKAALCMGFKADHFYASTGPDSIRRLEGETDNEYQIRINSVSLHSRLASLPYMKSKHSPSMQTHCFRALWRCFHLSANELRVLFQLKSGSPRHCAAVRSILTMVSPVYDMHTKQMEEIIKSID